MDNFELENWLPMEPSKGPPLPRFLNIFWPWYKPLQKGDNIVRWTKGPTHVEDALADIIDYVDHFWVLRETDQEWIVIDREIWDSWAIPRDYICGIVVDRVCAMPEGFVWVE